VIRQVGAGLTVTTVPNLRDGGGKTDSSRQEEMQAGQICFGEQNEAAAFSPKGRTGRGRNCPGFD